MIKKTLLAVLCLTMPVTDAMATINYFGDKDDPTSVTSFIGMRTGTNGYGAIGQLGIKPDQSHWAHNSFLQLKDDFETAHLRHFSLYKRSGTGLFLDAQHNNSGRFDVNRASLGLIQIIPVGETIRVNPAILYGETWTTDKQIEQRAFPDTPIATLYTFVKWQIHDGWFLNLVPQYTYSTSGRNIRLFEMTTQLGYNISPQTSMSINADDEDEVWLTIKHAL
ncbi:hypothetical protein [Photobacterium atrarenae]|uniref:DUF481 domain-containing protein n=1 Tax=Photobacterium atrarenae TaxID=865757 RepID=A0ABY5GMB5_9GAMM|nr:hypothetical protein [Photobacterium atrarenae]UTV30473.1 hypothetical protein NNL38_18020 [Photobacterium atrarenae]